MARREWPGRRCIRPPPEWRRSWRRSGCWAGIASFSLPPSLSRCSSVLPIPPPHEGQLCDIYDLLVTSLPRLGVEKLENLACALGADARDLAEIADRGALDFLQGSE